MEAENGKEEDWEDEDEVDTCAQAEGVEGTDWDWGMKIDPHLRKWIQSTECRRDILDEYFNNPRSRKRELIVLHGTIMTTDITA